MEPVECDECNEAFKLNDDKAEIVDEDGKHFLIHRSCYDEEEHELA